MKTKKTKIRVLSPTELRRVREIASLLYFAELAKELKVPPFPLRGYRPKIIRHQSQRQRIVSGQSANPTRAIYVPESKWNITPIDKHPEKTYYTREVGPADVHNPSGSFRSGKK